jgi:hypothetical protein
MQHSLKLGGTNYHFKWGKVPGTAPYWKAWLYMYHAALSNLAPYLKKWIKRSKVMQSCYSHLHQYYQSEIKMLTNERWCSLWHIYSYKGYLLWHNELK